MNGGFRTLTGHPARQAACRVYTGTGHSWDGFWTETIDPLLTFAQNAGTAGMY